ncbi:MAG: medium chain dehydrogenase/reductase family protein [Thermoleophilaceae bacterium]
MRAVLIERHGDPETLAVRDRPEPSLAPGRVLVRVRAAGVNFADIQARVGLYPDAPDLPFVPGYEFAGDVEEVGEGVEDIAPGDRVMGPCRFGGYAELVSVGAADVIALPADWSYEDGAAFPIVYATAYAALVSFGGVRGGDRVLIQAAAGGVGIAATQISKLLGAEVFGTASGSKHDAIRGFGVDHPIDYREKDFAAEVRRIAGEDQPLDLIMDAVGGKSWRDGYKLLRPGGRLVAFGASTVVTGDKRSYAKAARALLRTPYFQPIKLASDSKSIIGLNMLRLWDDRGSTEEWVEPLSQWIDQGLLRPVVAQAFPLERAADAHRFIQERKNVGKVVLTV